MPTIPKLSLSASKVTHVLKLPEFWAVASALVLAPIIAPIASQFLTKIPFLAKYPTASFIGLGILILLLAATMGAGIMRAVVLGVGAAFVIIALVPVIRQYAGR